MLKRMKKLMIAGMICSLFLTSCGGGNYSSDSGSTSYKTSEPEAYSYDSDMATEEAAYDESYDVSDDSSEGGTAVGLDTESTTPNVASKKITKDKLIYTCNLSIDTLDFDDSVKKLSALIEKNDGFIETEEYSDGNNYDYYSYYYIEDNDKHNQYTATVRIPSDKYDAFLNDAANLGDIRSKNANVENVSQEYSDLNVSLEIYEAAYDRYMKLLSEATDESYALHLQQQLTDTQIEIARIKTRLNKIDTDVSYSFINIRIREVSKYDEKPMPKDTFGQRLISEIKDTAEGFLDFLEGLLFLIIHLAPYIALIAIVCAVIGFIRKKLGKTPLRESWRQKRELRRERKMQKAGRRGQMMPGTQIMTGNTSVNQAVPPQAPGETFEKKDDSSADSANGSVSSESDK